MINNLMIPVLGFYNKGNIGDEAYKIAFPKLFPHLDLEFTDKIKGDTVILGGGDVLNPHFIKQIQKCTNKYALSVSTTNNFYINNFNGVISRDKVVETEKLIYAPDFTFILEANAIRGKIILEKAFKANNCLLYENIVIVVMNAFLYQGEARMARDHVNFDRVCFEMAKLIDSTNASFVFLPFGNGFPQNDCITNGILYSRCKFWEKNLLWFSPLDVQDALDICAAANVMIGSRLHALIFSCIGGTPFINLSHHDKTKSFMETVNKQEYSIDYWKFNYSKLEFLLNNLLSGNKLHKEFVKVIYQNNKDQLVALRNCFTNGDFAV